MSDDDLPGKGATALLLLFFGVSGVAAVVLIFLQVRPGPPSGPDDGPYRSAVFDDARPGEKVQARVLSQSRSRIERGDSVPMANLDNPLAGARSGRGAGHAGGSAPGGEVPAPAGESGADDSVLSKTVKGWGEDKAEELGANKGMLSSLAGKLLKKPKVIRALFNNKLLVKAYMKRPLVQKNCRSASSLKGYLMDGSSAGGVQEEVSMVTSFMKRSPSSASAFAGTRFAQALMNCPSAKSLMSDTGSVQQIMGANPAFGSLIHNPTFIGALAGSPTAMDMYKQGTSGLPE